MLHHLMEPERKYVTLGDQNARRLVENDAALFMLSTDYHLLVIDESSTVNNNDMVKILNKVNFNLILLVGDTHQITSIRFGNWFTALRHFSPETSVFELTQPYRAKDNQRLQALWSKVREMFDDAKEYVVKQRRSLKVDHSLFVKSDEDEVTLCLNYDGLYGINNINRFLQESNDNRLSHGEYSNTRLTIQFCFLNPHGFIR